VAEFDTNGVVLPLRGISEAEAGAIAAEIERAERVQKVSASTLFHNGHLKYSWMHELVTNPTILDMVGDLLGPEFWCWKSQLWIKEPLSGAFIGWHQDAAYWGLDPPDCVGVPLPPHPHAPAL
jgi:hypothetical protein